MRPNTRTAYSRVQYQEKSFFGRVIVQAILTNDGTRISGTYPAQGADSVEFDIGVSEKILDNVEKLRAYIAENWQEFEPAVATARRRRYALRRIHIQKESE